MISDQPIALRVPDTPSWSCPIGAVVSPSLAPIHWLFLAAVVKFGEVRLVEEKKNKNKGVPHSTISHT